MDRREDTEGRWGATIEGNNGSSGNWAAEARKLVVSVRNRNLRGGSATWVEKLRVRLVRNAPSTILRAEDCIVTRGCRDDLLVWL